MYLIGRILFGSVPEELSSVFLTDVFIVPLADSNYWQASQSGSSIRQSLGAAEGCSDRPVATAVVEADCTTGASGSAVTLTTALATTGAAAMIAGEGAAVTGYAIGNSTDVLGIIGATGAVGKAAVIGVGGETGASGAVAIGTPALTWRLTVLFSTELAAWVRR